MTMTVDASDAAGDVITDDVTNASLSTTRALQDVTGLADTAHERLQLLGDGGGSLNGVFNDALSHVTLADIATHVSSRTVVAAHSGQTLTMESFFTAYDLSRAADGSLTWSAPFQLANETSFGWS
jgi:hypothetical protein